MPKMKPSPEKFCQDEQFTQTCSQWVDQNNCGFGETPTTTQTATGTKDCST